MFITASEMHGIKKAGDDGVIKILPDIIVMNPQTGKELSTYGEKIDNYLKENRDKYGWIVYIYFVNQWTARFNNEEYKFMEENGIEVQNKIPLNGSFSKYLRQEAPSGMDSDEYRKIQNCLGSNVDRIAVWEHSRYGIEEYEASLWTDPERSVDVIGFDIESDIMETAFSLFNVSANFRVLTSLCFSSNDGMEGYKEKAVKLMDKNFGTAIV